VTLLELSAPVAWASAAHLAIWSAGSYARERIFRGSRRDDDPLVRAFQSALLGFTLAACAAMVLGALRLLYAPLLAALILLLAAAGAWKILLARPWSIRKPGVSDVPWIASIVFVGAHLPRALSPVLEHDENVYHLLLPKLYLASHALVPLPWSLGANMPHLVDLSYVIPTAMGGFTAAKVFALGFIVWTLVGLAPFGRTLLGPVGPGMLAVLYLSGRTIQWHLGLAYVEPIIGALVLGAVQALWNFSENGEGAELLVLAVAAGAACASKYTVWPFVVVLFAIATLIRLPQGRRADLRRLAVMVGTCALLVAPWLIKNAVVTGNPIYPNAYGWFGGAWWSRIQEIQFQHEMGYGRGAATSVWEYVRLPWQLVSDPYTGMLGGASFSFSVMVLLLASMAFPWRRGDLRTTLRVLSISAFVFWCLGSKQTRYLVAFVPVMVLAAGTVLAPLRRVRVGLASAAIAVVLIAVVQIRLQPSPAEPLLSVFQVSRDELLTRNLCWDLTAFLNQVVPRGGKVLSFWENRLYFLDRPFIADSAYGAPTVLAGLREAGDAHAFAVERAAEGVTHVLVNPYVYKTYMENGFLYNMIDPAYYPEERLRADNELFNRFVNDELEEVPWDGGWAVFRLRAAAATTPG
jgi:hypothetical protein